MRPVLRKRAFSLGLAGLFKVPLSCLLPGASTYWGVGARRLARRRLAAGGTGVVVSCRMPSVGQRGRDVVDGWDDVEVVVNDAAVARFWSVFRKSARWLELPAGLVRVRVEGGGPLPLPRLEFGLSEGEVVIVEVVPAMRTGPRRIDPPRVTVFGSTNRELARWEHTPAGRRDQNKQLPSNAGRS